MKTLKIGIVALLLTLTSFAFAQGGEGMHRTPEERATMQSKKLVEQLGLSADQEKKIYTLCLQNAQQQEADRGKYQGDHEAMRNARMQSMQDLNSKIEGVLTADQKTKFQQIKEEEKAKFQNRQSKG